MLWNVNIDVGNDSIGIDVEDNATVHVNPKRPVARNGGSQDEHLRLLRVSWVQAPFWRRFPYEDFDSHYWPGLHRTGFHLGETAPSNTVMARPFEGALVITVIPV